MDHTMVPFFAGTVLSWALLAVLLPYVVYKVLRFGHREKYLPPGPRTIPILGNAHQIPSRNFFSKLKEWSDQYGSVFSLKVGRSTVVVLNDRQAIYELVNRRSVNYQDRPRDKQWEIVHGNKLFILMDASTPLWRANRKTAAQWLTPMRLDGEMAKIQNAEITTLIYDLLRDPEGFEGHMMRSMASAATIAIYGQRATSPGDFWTTFGVHASEKLNAVLEPGTYLPVNDFPILKLFPNRWNSGKQRAEDTFRMVTRIYGEARQRVDKRRMAGDKRGCLVDRFLDGDLKSDVPLNDSTLNQFLGTLLAAAVSTTLSATRTHILFLAKYPQFQEKAQVELDRICGSERMPVWSDFAQLPYINCIIKEGLRIRTVAPVGVPHRATQDDWYKGMLIPKDATIFIPAYALHQTHYPDPETYNPDRYLNHPKPASHYAASPDYANRDHYAYGAGRRICVGIHLAERTQWKLVASLLWAFSIEQVVDEEGRVCELDPDAYTEGLTYEPLPFRVKMVVRSERHAEVVRRGFEGIRDFLKEWE